MRTLSLAVAAATLLLSAYSASAFTIVSSGAGGFGAGLADPDDMVRQLALGGQGGGNSVLGLGVNRGPVSAPSLITSQGVLAPNYYYSHGRR
jgi:opacity protein-like surface antigen